MDRNYYYRLLGLRPDATQAQIRDAYNSRMARLDSADFADEPEYAKRKKAQATEAYKVLIGAAPVPEADPKRYENKKRRVERRDAFEEDDFGDEGGPKINISMPKLNIGNVAKYGTKKAGDKAKLSAVGTAITIFIVVASMFSAIGDLISDDDYYPDFLYMDEIQNVEEYCADYYYYQELDTSTVGNERINVDWYEGQDVYVSDFDEYSTLRNNMVEMLYEVDIYDAEELFYYITDDLYYFCNYDDYECAMTLIDWMGVPEFDEIAGATSLYNGDPILSLSDYMEFLEEYYYEYY